MCACTLLIFFSWSVSVFEISLVLYHPPMLLVYIHWQEASILLLPIDVNTILQLSVAQHGKERVFPTAMRGRFVLNKDNFISNNGNLCRIIPIFQWNLTKQKNIRQAVASRSSSVSSKAALISSPSSGFHSFSVSTQRSCSSASSSWRSSFASRVRSIIDSGWPG